MSALRQMPSARGDDSHQDRRLPARHPTVSGRTFTTLIGLSVGLYGLVARPRLLRWGATDEEVQGPYPGADLIPGGRRGATMAVTIDAPPSRVWPWLVQMGCDRAGWYSWDRLDNGGVESAQQIHSEWQTIAAGDRLASSPSANGWFEVAALDHERFLALRAPVDLRGRPFATAGPRPRLYSDSSWCFLLKPAPRNQTRLVISGSASSHPRPLTAICAFLFWEPAHWIMQTRQFTNLKLRAERTSQRVVDAASDGGLPARPRRSVG
jgi:hypothetical protein